MAVLSGTRVLVLERERAKKLATRSFGEPSEEGLILSLVEAAYLLEKGELDVYDANQKLDFKDLLELGERVERNFYSKYLVYKDLRGRGLLVRTGLKFGCDFRVYERGAKSIKEEHSKYLVHVVPEEYTCSFPELVRAVRLAHAVKKEMVFAVVDEEGCVTYYQVSRLKL